MTTNTIMMVGLFQKALATIKSQDRMFLFLPPPRPRSGGKETAIVIAKLKAKEIVIVSSENEGKKIVIVNLTVTEDDAISNTLQLQILQQSLAYPLVLPRNRHSYFYMVICAASRFICSAGGFLLSYGSPMSTI
jgi:hypothetical protein